MWSGPHAKSKPGPVKHKSTDVDRPGKAHSRQPDNVSDVQQRKKKRTVHPEIEARFGTYSEEENEHVEEDSGDDDSDDDAENKDGDDNTDDGSDEDDESESDGNDYQQNNRDLNMMDVKFEGGEAKIDVGTDALRDHKHKKKSSKQRRNQFYPKRPQPVHHWANHAPGVKEMIDSEAQDRHNANSNAPYVTIWNKVSADYWKNLTQEERDEWTDAANESTASLPKDLKLT
jgi:hypothetical protein